MLTEAAPGPSSYLQKKLKSFEDAPGGREYLAIHSEGNIGDSASTVSTGISAVSIAHAANKYEQYVGVLCTKSRVRYPVIHVFGVRYCCRNCGLNIVATFILGFDTYLGVLHVVF